MDNDDFIAIPANISTVIDLLDTKGISWAEYQKAIPYQGFQGFSFSNQVSFANDYVRKHDPLILFKSVTQNATRLQLIKGFTAFSDDLRNRRLPQWAFITPNMTDDGHDTNMTFSVWERNWITPLLNNSCFINNTIALLTFDETESYTEGNKPFAILLGGAILDSLLLWTFGGLFTICSTAVWLEFSLSVPLYRVEDGPSLKSVPRSGGEKNYVRKALMLLRILIPDLSKIEFVYWRYPFLATCMYGIPFILLGNLAGNAITFGMFFMESLGNSNPNHGSVIGAALAVLTVTVLLHMFSRLGGILVNNGFAIIKVLILLSIIILGFIKAGGGKLGGEAKAMDNFNSRTSFSGSRSGAAAIPDHVTSLLYVLYSYSGFEQHFYTLSECSNPRKIFPWATITAMGTTTCLFVLVNVACLCAVPKEVQLANIDEPLASLFFKRMFGDSEAAQRAMAALVAISIFGNLVVMTFTASRVKQEIAKEGVLPFSLFFATGHTSLWSSFYNKFIATEDRRRLQDPDQHPEQTPMAALGLHLLTSCTLVGVTSMLEPANAYSVLVSLYSYCMVIMIAFFVSGGLLYLKFVPTPASEDEGIESARKEWSERSKEDRFRPGPVPAVICFVVYGFALIAYFAKPADDSPFSYPTSSVRWYVVPTIGVSTLLWGFIWWIGLKVRMAQRTETLTVDRVPWIEEEEPGTDRWIQKGEWVRHYWLPGSGRKILRRD
jgi:amino acid transporter